VVAEAAAAAQLQCGVAIPVLLEGRKLGVIGLAFRQARRFGEPEQSWMLTAGRLSAQAFERVSLFEAEKRARAEAERAIDLRDEFLSVASHELKTPLTVVQMQLRRALRFRGEGNAQRLQVALSAAERSAARLGRLIDNLLDVSQVRSDNSLMLDLERVDLYETLQEVAERFKDELDRSGSELKLESHEEICGLWDRLRIEQITSSLLSNAIKFGLGEPIHVEATRRGEQACLIVRDGGLGIAPEDQQRIFKRFERAVSVRNFGGFGLGLWLTRQSVEALGGTIEVQSEPGVSSTFVVTLPCAGPAAAIAPGPASRQAAQEP
jgi:signal transduction histidine kinase